MTSPLRTALQIAAAGGELAGICCQALLESFRPATDRQVGAAERAVTCRCGNFIPPASSVRACKDCRHAASDEEVSVHRRVDQAIDSLLRCQPCGVEWTDGHRFCVAEYATPTASPTPTYTSDVEQHTCERILDEEISAAGPWAAGADALTEREADMEVWEPHEATEFDNDPMVSDSYLRYNEPPTWVTDPLPCGHRSCARAGYAACLNTSAPVPAEERPVSSLPPEGTGPSPSDVWADSLAIHAHDAVLRLLREHEYDSFNGECPCSAHQHMDWADYIDHITPQIIAAIFPHTNP